VCVRKRESLHVVSPLIATLRMCRRQSKKASARGAPALRPRSLARAVLQRLFWRRFMRAQAKKEGMPRVWWQRPLCTQPRQVHVQALRWSFHLRTRQDPVWLQALRRGLHLPAWQESVRVCSVWRGCLVQAQPSPHTLPGVRALRDLQARGVMEFVRHVPPAQPPL